MLDENDIKTILFSFALAILTVIAVVFECKYLLFSITSFPLLLGIVFLLSLIHVVITYFLTKISLERFF